MDVHKAQYGQFGHVMVQMPRTVTVSDSDRGCIEVKDTVLHCHKCQHSVDCAGLDKDYVEHLAKLHRDQHGHTMVLMLHDGWKLKTGKVWIATENFFCRGCQHGVDCAGWDKGSTEWLVEQHMGVPVKSSSCLGTRYAHLS